MDVGYLTIVLFIVLYIFAVIGKYFWSSIWCSTRFGTRCGEGTVYYTETNPVPYHALLSSMVPIVVPLSLVPGVVIVKMV